MELDFDAAPTVRLAYRGAMTEFSWRLADPLPPAGRAGTRLQRDDGPQSCAATLPGAGRRAEVEFIWEPPLETLIFYCIRGTLVLKMRNLAEWNLEPDQCLLIPAGAAGATPHQPHGHPAHPPGHPGGGGED